MYDRYTLVDECEAGEEHVVLKVGVEPGDPGQGLRPLDEGGIEDLWNLGFSLEKSIDPTKRNPDGTYAPLDPLKI